MPLKSAFIGRFAAGCCRETQTRFDVSLASQRTSVHTPPFGCEVTRCATNVDKAEQTAHRRAHIPDSQSGARRSPGEASWWLLCAGDSDAAAAACACVCAPSPNAKKQEKLPPNQAPSDNETPGRTVLRERLCVNIRVSISNSNHIRILFRNDYRSACCDFWQRTT